jgi:hypothetical protein
MTAVPLLLLFLGYGAFGVFALGTACRRFRLSLLEACVVVSIAVEYYRKLGIILSPHELGALGLWAMGLPILTVIPYFDLLRRIDRRKIPGQAARCLAVFLVLLSILTLSLRSGEKDALHGLVFVLYSASFWYVGVASRLIHGRLLMKPKLISFLACAALTVAAYNAIVGPDPVWAAYIDAASEFSHGAAFARKSYSPGIFSSSELLAAFMLLSASLLLVEWAMESRGRRIPRLRVLLLVFVTCMGALVSGSRYSFFGVAAFWIACFALRLVRVPALLILLAIIVAWPAVQDYILPQLMQADIEKSAGEDAFSRRLETVGSGGARTGQIEAAGRILAAYPLIGRGMNFLKLEIDTRHNVLLNYVEYTGVPGFLLFLGFFAYQIRACRAVNRTVVWPPVVCASLIVGLLAGASGGPDPLNMYSMLAAGALAAAMPALRHVQRTRAGLTGGFEVAPSYRRATSARAAKQPGNDAMQGAGGLAGVFGNGGKIQGPSASPLRSQCDQ